MQRQRIQSVEEKNGRQVGDKCEIMRAENQGVVGDKWRQTSQRQM